MKVLSLRTKSSSGDEIPLNKSFESTGTSDQFLERDNDSQSMSEPVTRLLSVTAVQNPRRPSFASTETLKVRNSARSMPILLNTTLPATLYSASLSTMLESPYDFCDEPEPRAVVVPRPPISESEEDECKSEFFDKMIAIKSDLNRRWMAKTRSAPEESNMVGTETVWVEQAKFVSYDKESSEDLVDETRAHAIDILQSADEQEASSNCNESNNCNEIVWKAWGCNDLTTRRHIMCFMFLLFLLVFVVALLIGLHSTDKPAQTVSAANNPQNPDGNDSDAWIGDQSDNKPSENTAKPKPLPTNIPKPAPTESPRSPTESPLRPSTVAAPSTSSTPKPALSYPQSGVSPSSWPSMPSSPAPTIAPTYVNANIPTVKPSLATPIPTNAPTNSPSGQPSICQSSLTVNKLCYVEDQDMIVINFVNCSPLEGDWVGIWRTREDPNNLSQDFLAWAFSCGTQTCQRSPVSRRIALEAYGLGFDSFRAFLVHDTFNDTPYVVEAMSEPFVVTDFCRD